MPFKQFIINHKVASGTAIVIAAATIISSIVFFKNNPTKQTQETKLQFTSLQSSVVSSSSSSPSSMSSSSVTISSSSQSISSSAISEVAVKEVYVPATVTPTIPKNIDTNKLGFVKSFAQTVNTPVTKILLSEDNIDLKKTENPTLDFTQADIDFLLAESQKLIDDFDKADINNPDSFKPGENQRLSEISTKVTKFQRDNPEEFEKLFPGIKSKMDGFLNTLIEKAITKFAPKIIEGFQELGKKGEAMVAKCKQYTNGFQYQEIIAPFGENVNAKLKVYDRSKVGLENIIEYLKKNCGNGNYTFYDSQATDFTLYFEPKINFDDDGKALIPDKYKNYLGSVWIYDGNTNYFEYYPDYLAEFGYKPEVTNSTNVIMLK
jgi:hypothetical protein